MRAGKVVGVEKVCEVVAKLVVAVVVIALDGRVLDRPVYTLDLHGTLREFSHFKRAMSSEAGQDHLQDLVATLHATDHMFVEATGNATAGLEVLAPNVERVAVANPFQVYLIAWAKTKTDKIGARILAQLYAGGFLPEVWVPEEAILARRRQSTRRNQLVKSRVRLKLIGQSILHAHLVPRCPHADPFGRKGQAWMLAQELPATNVLQS